MTGQLDKKIIVIAGPNGAGKTTFAEEFLPKEANCPIFVNVDLIAAGLAPFDPDRAAVKAGRLMLQEIHRYAIAKNNLPLVDLVIHKPEGKRKLGLLAGKFTVPDNSMDEDPEIDAMFYGNEE